MDPLTYGWLMLAAFVLCFVGFIAVLYYAASDFDDAPDFVPPAEWHRVTKTARTWADRPSQYRKVE